MSTYFTYYSSLVPRTKNLKVELTYNRNNTNVSLLVEVTALPCEMQNETCSVSLFFTLESQHIPRRPTPTRSCPYTRSFTRTGHRHRFACAQTQMETTC